MDIKAKKLVLTLTIGLLLGAGCTSPGNIQKTESSPATQSVSPIGSETPIQAEVAHPTDNVTATPEPGNNPQISYVIDARLDYFAKQLEVDQVITIEGILAGIPEMALVVEPNRYYNGFTLHSLEVDRVEVTQYSLDGNQLRFDLPEGAQTTGSGVIHLTYSLSLPQIPPPSDLYKPQPFGYTDRQVNLVDWYAIVPPLDEAKAWIIHEPPIFGEAMVYPVANFDIALTAEYFDLPLVVAASSMAEQNENRYTFSMPSARTFAISISPYYQTVEREIDGISVTAYAFEEYDEQNSAVLQNAAEALALFTEKYGRLPIKSVSIVQADFLDGMEYNGLYFLSKGFYDLYDGTVKGYLTLIAVHEMAHQWWFSVVGSDQALEPWLDEGLATFAELEYIERYHPNLEEWWWFYRVNVYEPEGYINQSIYDYRSYTAYRNAVYLRGAAFLADLRTEIGEAAFDRGMRKYYQDNYLKIAHEKDFFDAMKAESNGPSEALMNRYLDDIAK